MKGRGENVGPKHANGRFISRERIELGIFLIPLQKGSLHDGVGGFFLVCHSQDRGRCFVVGKMSDNIFQVLNLKSQKTTW